MNNMYGTVQIWPTECSSVYLHSMDTSYNQTVMQECFCVPELLGLALALYPTVEPDPLAYPPLQSSWKGFLNWSSGKPPQPITLEYVIAKSKSRFELEWLWIWNLISSSHLKLLYCCTTLRSFFWPIFSLLVTSINLSIYEGGKPNLYFSSSFKRNINSFQVS